MKYTVYGIQLKKTNKVVYVGMTGNLPSRLSCHRSRATNPNCMPHYNLPLYQMIRKHGLDAFRVVGIASSTDQRVASHKEIKAIKELNTICNIQHNRGVK